MKNMKQLLSISFILMYGLMFAQTPSLNWANSIGNSSDKNSNAIAVDTSGNSYITGYFSGTMDFNPGAGVYNMTAKGSFDLFTYKLDASGNFVWAIQLSSDTVTASVQGKGIAVNAAGQVYLTGSFQRTVDFDPGTGISNVTCAGVADVFVLKLDSDGKFIFVKTMGGPNTDVAYAINLDKSGNIYTTGVFMGTSDFDPGPGVFNIVNTSQSVDAFVSKLDPSGNFLWAKSFGGTDSDIGYALTTDMSQNTYITGSFSKTVDFDPGANTFNLTSAGSTDIFVLKLDASGNFSWADRMGGVSADYAYSIAIDASKNIYLTGGYIGDGSEDFDPGVGTLKLPSVSNTSDAFVLKLTAAGTLTWAKSFGGTAGDSGSSIALDASGNIHIIGHFRNTVDFDPGAGTFNMTSLGGADIYALSLNTNGNFIYAGQISGPGEDFGTSMALDKSGFPAITGVFQKTVDFDPTGGTFNLTAVQGYYYDIYTLKLGNIAPSIQFTSSTKTICYGQSVSITATAGGTTGSYTYLWSPAGSVSNPTFANITASPASTTTYTCVVTDSKGTKNTGTITINVNPLPNVTASTPVETICSGQHTNIFLTSSSPGTTFSWVPQTIQGNVTGASSGFGSIISQALSGVGVLVYKVTGTAGACSSTPYNVTITVKGIIKVATQPLNTFVCKGTVAHLNVAASNVKSYQWQVNTDSIFTNIAEAVPYSNTQTSTLTITGVSDSLTAYQYRVVMTDSCGGPVYSNAVKLSTTDTIQPSFTSCPVNDTIQPGVYNYTLPLATDNCTQNITIIRTAGLGSGAVFPEGNTVETYEAMDESGNKSVCSFIVTAKTNTSIHSINVENNIHIYPNPASDQIRISFAAVQQHNFSVTLKDITGKIILNTDYPASTNEVTIDLKERAKGIYMLHIYNNDFQKIEKIVVE